MEEKRNKKSKIIKGVALLGLFLLVFGVSYALFSVVLNGTKRNKITTANFGLSLTDINGFEEEEGYGINLENALPITDEEGLKTEAYQFVVTNTGNIPASYKLKLVDDKENTLNDQYIKYNLVEENYLKTKENTHYRGGLYNTEPKLLNTLNNRVLDEITILPGEKIEYTLNLWLDYDADNNAMNKEFSGKIMVDGTQAIAYTKGKAGDKIDYTLYKDGTLIFTGTGEMKDYREDWDYDNETITIRDNGTVLGDIINQELKKKGKNTFSFANVDSTTITDDFWTFFEIYDDYLGGSTYIVDKLDDIYKYDLHACLADESDCRNYTELIEYVFSNDYNAFRETMTLLDDIPKIKNVTIDEGITLIGSGDIYVGDYMLTLPSTLTSLKSKTNELSIVNRGYTLIIPENVTELSYLGLAAKEVRVPGHIKTINHGLQGPVLKRIIFEEGVERIEGSSLFNQVYDMEFYIPNSVSYIGPHVFNGIKNVTITIDNSEEFVKNNWDSAWCGEATKVYNIKYLR